MLKPTTYRFIVEGVVLGLALGALLIALGMTFR
jgi:hypothetical protein